MPREHQHLFSLAVSVSSSQKGSAGVTVVLLLSPGRHDNIHCIFVSYRSCDHPLPPRSDVPMSITNEQTVNLGGSESITQTRLSSHLHVVSPAPPSVSLSSSCPLSVRPSVSWSRQLHLSAAPSRDNTAAPVAEFRNILITLFVKLEQLLMLCAKDFEMFSLKRIIWVKKTLWPWPSGPPRVLLLTSTCLHV